MSREGPHGVGLQRSYSMATLSGSTALSLVNVHSAVGVWVQATCAGWPGGTVWNQGMSHACWSVAMAAVQAW